MAKPRKTYSREFKLKAVKTLVESGRTQHQVAKDIGINTNLLWQWKKQHQRELQQTEPPREEPVDESSSSGEVIAFLNRRIAKLEEERDMLCEMLHRYKERFK